MDPEMRITLADLTDPASPTRLPDDATGVDWGNWIECFDIIQESWHDPAGPQEGTLVIGHPGPCDMHRELEAEDQCGMAPQSTTGHTIHVADPYRQDLADATPLPMVWFDRWHGDDEAAWVYRDLDRLDTALGANDPEDPDAAVAEVLRFPVGSVEVAKLLGVQAATVAQWRQRGLLPGPDWTVGGRPAWRLGTILAWARETGRL
jgi:hypothetical protein